MKINKKKVILTIILIIAIVVFIIAIIKKDKNIQNSTFINEYETIDKNQISYSENATIDDLKKDISATGETEIYEIREEYDGRKILAIKPSVKLKIAFAGIIKKSIPELSEADEIMNNNFPKENGIWIEDDSKTKVLNLFNESSETNSEYSINESGYIEILNKNKQTDFDKKIEKILKSNKKYVLCVSSVYYIVDELTGEILDFNFEDMFMDQVLDSFSDDDKNIIFITENRDNKFNNNEILSDIVELLQI